MKNKITTSIICFVIGILISQVLIVPHLKAKPKTMWGDAVKPDKIGNATITHAHFILFTKPDGTRYEAGLRSDGVVVWREIK